MTTSCQVNSWADQADLVQVAYIQASTPQCRSNRTARSPLQPLQPLNTTANGRSTSSGLSPSLPPPHTPGSGCDLLFLRKPSDVSLRLPPPCCQGHMGDACQAFSLVWAHGKCDANVTICLFYRFSPILSCVPVLPHLSAWRHLALTQGRHLQGLWTSPFPFLL